MLTQRWYDIENPGVGWPDLWHNTEPDRTRQANSLEDMKWPNSDSSNVLFGLVSLVWLFGDFDVFFDLTGVLVIFDSFRSILRYFAKNIGFIWSDNLVLTLNWREFLQSEPILGLFGKSFCCIANDEAKPSFVLSDLGLLDLIDFELLDPSDFRLFNDFEYLNPIDLGLLDLELLDPIDLELLDPSDFRLLNDFEYLNPIDLGLLDLELLDPTDFRLLGDFPIDFVDLRDFVRVDFVDLI